MSQTDPLTRQKIQQLLTEVTLLKNSLMIGSGNSAWVPCIPSLENVVGKMVYNGGIANVDGTDFSFAAYCPLPTNRGGLKLYIKGMRADLQDCDADDYMTKIELYGSNSAGATQLANDDTDRGTDGVANTFTTAFAAVDLSGYKVAFLYIGVFASTLAEFGLASCEVDAYYAS